MCLHLENQKSGGHVHAPPLVQYWEHMPWRVYLCGRLTQFYYLAHRRGWSKEQTQPWTEYNLYWVFAEHSGEQRARKCSKLIMPKKGGTLLWPWQGSLAPVIRSIG